MTDRNLDALLARTAREVRYPATPDLRSRVLASLTPAAPAAPAWRARPAWVFVLAAALVVLAALAISPSRDAIARLFGVEGSRIEILPSPLPGETATPFPTPASRATADARNVQGIALDRLPSLAGFAAALPDVEQERTGSDLLFYGSDPVVVHRYPGFDLWQSRIEGSASFGKLVEHEGSVEDVEVGGVPGRWVTGGEHIVSYTDRNGAHIPASERIVQESTLIWRTEAFFYRMETDLPLAEALRIAQTLP